MRRTEKSREINTILKRTLWDSKGFQKKKEYGLKWLCISESRPLKEL